MNDVSGGMDVGPKRVSRAGRVRVCLPSPRFAPPASAHLLLAALEAVDAHHLDGAPAADRADQLAQRGHL